MGKAPAAKPEPEPEQAIPPTPEPDQAEPPQTQPTEAPEEQAAAPTNPDLEALKHRIKEIYAVAVRKQIVSLVLQQFKLDRWEDFLAFPEMIPTLEQFVEQAAPAPPEKPKRR